MGAVRWVGLALGAIVFELAMGALAGCSPLAGISSSSGDKPVAATVSTHVRIHTRLEHARHVCIPILQKALDKSGLDPGRAQRFIQIGNDGNSLLLALPPLWSAPGFTAQKEVAALTVRPAMSCLLKETQAPRVVSQHITTQTHSDWGSMTLSWTYKTDKGVNAIWVETVPTDG